MTPVFPVSGKSTQKHTRGHKHAYFLGDRRILPRHFSLARKSDISDSGLSSTTIKTQLYKLHRHVSIPITKICEMFQTSVLHLLTKRADKVCQISSRNIWFLVYDPEEPSSTAHTERQQREATSNMVCVERQTIKYIATTQHSRKTCGAGKYLSFETLVRAS